MSNGAVSLRRPASSPPSLLGRARLLYHTVRPLRPSQWYARGRWMAYRRLYERLPSLAARAYGRRAARVAGAEPAWLLHASDLRACLATFDAEAVVAQAAELCQGRFTFLGDTASLDLSQSIDWSTPGRARLWRFHLHYFDYAVPLAVASLVTGEEQYAAALRALLLDWAKGNPVGRGDGWHPYAVSQRLVNWTLAYHLLLREGTADDLCFALRQQIALQSEYLSRHLEFDVRGNHLIENLRALIWSGLFLGGPAGRARASRALHALVRHLREQCLPDGGHYERSPMYHSIVLWNLLEICALARNAGMQLPEEIAETARAMARWLAAVLHPDGQIPLFNDAAFDAAPTPAELGAFADALWPGAALGLPVGAACLTQRLLLGEPGPRATRPAQGTHTELRPSGYFTFGDRTSPYGWAIVDAGDPCPTSLPGHAHSDLLSFELSLGHERLIVDSGVFEYERGAWRDYCRSTRAHNTVVVDEQEQSEAWHSFRLGRRAAVRGVDTFTRPGVRGLIASHDGFCRHARAALHTRAMLLLEERVWLIADRVGTSADGRRHSIESFLHWHPTVALCGEHTQGWQAGTTGHRVAVTSFGWEGSSLSAGETDPLQGWYCPRFGLRQPSPTLTFRAQAALPFGAGVVIATEAAAASAVRLSREELRLVVDGREFRVDLGEVFGAARHTR